jgi:dihydrofolate reductase
MRRIIVTEFISLDGVVEDPGGSENTKHGGWTFRFNDPEGMKFKFEELQTADTHLLGRETYEGFAAAWPERTGEFADRMNSMKKYVVSSTLSDPEWQNSEVIGVDDIERLDGNLIVAGSITLVQELLRRDLVDELRLMVFPIVLGSGRRLWGETDEDITLQLERAQTLDSGTVILTYTRRSAG